MGYPVAYRNSRMPSYTGGSQNPRTNYPAPGAANDPLPKQGRSIIPRTIPNRPSMPPIVKGIQRTALGGLKLAGRRLLLGPLGILQTANDIIDLAGLIASTTGAGVKPDLTGWSLAMDCARGGSNDWMSWYPYNLPISCGVTGASSSQTSVAPSVMRQVSSETFNGQSVWGILLLNNASFNSITGTWNATKGAYWYKPKVAGETATSVRPQSIPNVGIVRDPKDYPYSPGGADLTPANPIPWIYPHLDPLSVPHHAPRVTPQPIPFSLIPSRTTNPYRAPSEQTQRGNDVPGISRNPIRNQEPTIDVVLVPGVTRSTDPVTRVQPVPHKREKPTDDTVEKKTKPAIGWTGMQISKFFHGLTEVGDLVESLGDAIKDKALAKEWKKQKTFQAKLGFVAKHLNDIDSVTAVQNVIKNHFEDKLIGGLNRGVGSRTRRKHGLPVGMGFGPAL